MRVTFCAFRPPRVGDDVRVYTLAFGVTRTAAPMPDRIVLQFTQCGVAFEPVQCIAWTDTDPVRLDVTLAVSTTGSPNVHVLLQYADPADGRVRARAVTTVKRAHLLRGPPAPISIGDGFTLTALRRPIEIPPQFDTMEHLHAALSCLGADRTHVTTAAADDSALVTSRRRGCAAYHAPEEEPHRGDPSVPAAPWRRDVPTDRTALPAKAAELARLLGSLTMPRGIPTRDDAGLRAWIRATADSYLTGVDMDADRITAPVPWTAVANGPGGERVRTHSIEAHVERVRSRWLASPEVAHLYILMDALDTSANPAAPVLIAMPNVDAEHPATLGFVYSPGAWRWPIVWPTDTPPREDEPPAGVVSLGFWTPADIMALRRGPTDRHDDAQFKRACESLVGLAAHTACHASAPRAGGAATHSITSHTLYLTLADSRSVSAEIVPRRTRV